MCKNKTIMYLVRLFFASLILWPANASADTLLLSTGEFAPYSGKNLPKGGMSTEIIQKVFQEMGIDTKVHFLPWKRGEIETTNHRYFGTFPYVKTAKREKKFLFSEPTYISKTYFFVSKNFQRKFEKDDDLKGLAACVPKGYTKKALQPFIDKKIITFFAEPIDCETCFKMLKLDHVQLYGVNEVTGWNIIKKLFGKTDDFQTIGKPIAKNGYHLMVEKNYPRAKKILEAFNKGLAKLAKSNGLQEIINRHLN